MKLISWNINGLRAAERKGFHQWFAAENADMVCLQEIKAHPDQLSHNLRNIPGYHTFWHPAKRRGYSGLAIFTKQAPLQIIEGLQVPEFDHEGRVLSLRLRDFYLINVYFPHARRDLSRLEFKMAFNHRFLRFCQQLKQDSSLPLIVCGDFNAAHTQWDLTNDRANQKNAGFLPAERLWMDDFINSGMVDVFRQNHPNQKGHYTWWSQRRGVRDRNIGWRIDYHMVDQRLLGQVREARLCREILGSDHCPILLQLK